jgi:hypothetical protein
VNGGAHRSGGTIEEQVNPIDVLMHKAHRFQGGYSLLEIGPADEEIHVLGIPHGLHVNPCHPRRDRAAADHHVRHSRPSQRAGGTAGTLANSVHGSDHLFPREIVERSSGHFRRFRQDCPATWRPG